MTHSTNTFQYIKTNIWFQAVTQNPHQYMDFEDFLFWGTLKHKRVGQKHSAYRQILSKYQFTLRLFIKHLNPLSQSQQPVFHGDNMLFAGVLNKPVFGLLQVLGVTSVIVLDPSE